MSRFEFFLRVFCLLLAGSGWAAFAGALSRLHDNDDTLRDVTEAYAISAQQNRELRENYQKVQSAHESLQRLQDRKLQELEEKVGAYERRLRQLGIIQE